MVPKIVRIIALVLIGLLIEKSLASTSTLKSYDSPSMIQDKDNKTIYLSSDSESTTKSQLSPNNESLLSTNTLSTTSEAKIESSVDKIERGYVESTPKSKLAENSGISGAVTETEDSSLKSTSNESTNNQTENNTLNNKLVENGTIYTTKSNGEMITHSSSHDHNFENEKNSDSLAATSTPSLEKDNDIGTNSSRSTVKRDTDSKLTSLEQNYSKDDSSNPGSVNDNSSVMNISATSKKFENPKKPDLTATDSFPLDSPSSTPISTTVEEFTLTSNINQTFPIEFFVTHDGTDTSETIKPSTNILADLTTKIISSATPSTESSSTPKSVALIDESATTTEEMTSDEVKTTLSAQHTPEIKPIIRSRGQRSSVAKLDLMKAVVEAIPLEMHDSTSTSSENPVPNTLLQSELVSTTPAFVLDESTEFFNVSEDLLLPREVSKVVIKNNHDGVESTTHKQEITFQVPSGEKKKETAPEHTLSKDFIHEAESSIIVIVVNNTSLQSDYSTEKVDSTNSITTESQLKILNKPEEKPSENSQNKSGFPIIKANMDVKIKIEEETKHMPENKVKNDPQIFINSTTFQVLEKGHELLLSLDELIKSTSSPVVLDEKMVNDAPQPAPDENKQGIINRDISSKEDRDNVINSVQHIPNDKDDAETHSLVSQSLSGVPTAEPTSRTAKGSSEVHPIIVQPTISEDLVTVFDTRVMGSTSQVNTSAVDVNGLVKTLAEGEKSLQVLTATSEDLDNSSIVKQLTELTSTQDQTSRNTLNVRLAPQHDSVDNEQSSPQTIVGISSKTTMSVNQRVDKLNSSSSEGILSLTLQPDQPNEPSLNETSTLSSELDTSTSLSQPTTTVPTPPHILKPKIRFSGDRKASRAPISRTRPIKRPNPENDGTLVSVFAKSRTRKPSITSSTTYGTPTKYTFRRDGPIHIVGTETIVFSLPPTTTPLTTTEAEEEEEEEEEEVETSEDDIMEETISLNQSIFEEERELIKIAAELTVDKGLRWRETLNKRDSPEYKKQSDRMLRTLQRLFRDTPLSDSLHSIEIDGFIKKSKGKGSRSVTVDYSIFVKKSEDPVDSDKIITIVNEKLINNTFGRYLIDPISIKIVSTQPFVRIRPTEKPDVEPPIPQWAIAVIVIGAASFIFIVLFAAVTAYGRHHMRRRYANKLNDDDIERSDDSRDWENKLGTSAYENLAADGIYDVNDSVGSGNADMKRPKYVPPNPPRNPRMRHYDSWRTEWTEAPKRIRHPVNHIVF